ncbi:MAG: hypothetical protein WD535_01075 [Thermaerobacterales bacterium]
MLTGWLNRRGQRLQWLLFALALALVVAAGCGARADAPDAPPADVADESAPADSNGDDEADGSDDAPGTTDESAAPVDEPVEEDENDGNGGDEAGQPAADTDTSAEDAAAETPADDSAASAPPQRDYPVDMTAWPEAEPTAGRVSLQAWQSVAGQVAATAPIPDGFVLHGRLTDEEGRPISQGVVALEDGRLHNNNFVIGGLVHPDGTYAVKLPHAGDWGVHVYADGYIYEPHQIGVGRLINRQVEFDVTLVRQPAEMNHPFIADPRIYDLGSGRAGFYLETWDVNGDLSPQILAINIDTQQAVILDPPKDPVPEVVGVSFAKYANGTYAQHAELVGDGRGRWIFLSANHNCAMSEFIRVAWQ